MIEDLPEKYVLNCLYDVVLPTCTIPNAMPPEMAFVTYLHSMNDKKPVTRNTFFEQSIHVHNDNASPMTLIFGNSYGYFPNSMGGYNNLSSGPYFHMLEVHDDSLLFGKRYRQKYLYPIKVTPHIDDFAGVSRSGNKLAGEFFWKFMSDQALSDARKGNAIIFLDYAQENVVESMSYDRLHHSLEQSGIPKENIILGFNSFNAKETYESWYEPHQRRLEVINWPFVLSNTSYFYYTNNDAKIHIQDFYNSRNTIRDHHFLFKIRRPRTFRQALIYKLYNDDLLHLGDWSWLSDHKFSDSDISVMGHMYGFDLNVDKVRNLFNQCPHYLKDENHLNYSQISSWTDSQVESYKRTYFYICTETHTHQLYKSVTEKVAKPMANFLPFVFVSFQGALKLLRDIGFKTFSPFIDESYDDEPDEGKRVGMIYKEIEKICSMSKEDLHKWYWQMEDIYVHNYNFIQEYFTKDATSQEMIKYLCTRINT